jgi:hypothetical protein
VFAALVYDREPAIFRNDHGVVTGDARICDHNVFVHFSPDRKWTVVDDDGALFPVLHQNELRKQTAASFRAGVVGDVSGHELV